MGEGGCAREERSDAPPGRHLAAGLVAEGGKPVEAAALADGRGGGAEGAERMAERGRRAGHERRRLEGLGVARAGEDEEPPHGLPAGVRGGWKAVGELCGLNAAAAAGGGGGKWARLERKEPPLAVAGQLRLLRRPLEDRGDPRSDRLRVGEPVGPDGVEELRRDLREHRLVALEALRGELLRGGGARARAGLGLSGGRWGVRRRVGWCGRGGEARGPGVRGGRALRTWWTTR